MHGMHPVSKEQLGDRPKFICETGRAAGSSARAQLGEARAQTGERGWERQEHSWERQAAAACQAVGLEWQGVVASAM
eukprot:1627071-Karenia_brevis.AAC.1